MNYPSISIVVPSYNSSKYIERAIDSILNQNYPRIECIVVDGQSEDNTLNILKKYREQIKLISEKDKGESDAINKGFKVANGDIVSYLDTDDVYEPGAFQKVAEIFLKQPDLMWVCGKCRYIDEHEKEIRKIITYCKNYWLKRYSYKKLLIVNFIPQPSTFWRKQLINEIGPFDINIHLVNDYEYGLRAGAKYNPGLINSYLARQRMHPEQLTAKDVSGQLKETLFVARKYTSSKIILAMNFSFISCISLTYSALNQVRAFNKS